MEPEEDEKGTIFHIEGTDYLMNHYKIDDLAEYIEKFFKKNLKFAYKALINLDDSESNDE